MTPTVAMRSVPAARAPTPHRRRSRRWIRAVAPLVVTGGLWALAAIAHAIEEPDLRDPSTLAPTGTGPDGSSELAAMLEARGVRIDRFGTWQAAAAAAAGDTTLFVPMPDFILGDIVGQVADLPGSQRVVFVEPGAHLPFSNRRWATEVVWPRCSYDLATRAGPASVGRSRYNDVGPSTLFSCYEGGLVGLREGDTEIVLVGATDPFRNSRIHEAGNATLSVGLLSERPRVVWVDDHEPDRISVAPPRLRFPGYDRRDIDRSTGDSTFDAFPTVMWAMLALASAAALLLALARARRLGPPVAEPLPVLVSSAEAVTGRGRLYERIGAREATLDALRMAAIVRLNRVLNPFGAAVAERELTGRGAAATTPAAEDLIARVAARTGVPAPSVATILYAPPPDNDEELAAAVAQLDTLVTEVLRSDTGPAPLTQAPSSTQPGGTT